MGIDFEKLITQGMKWAKSVNPFAAVVAFATAVVLYFALEVHSLLSLLLALGVFAGITLLLPPTAETIPAPAIALTPEEEQFLAARESLARIEASIPRIMETRIPQAAKVAIRKGVTRIAGEIDRMLKVMAEDQKFIAAPLYFSMLVHPFENLWQKELRMLVREVEGTDYQYFDTMILPSFERAAREFYQQYHRSEVIDLAVLMEILMDNLSSFLDEQDDLGRVDADCSNVPDEAAKDLLAGGGRR